MSLDCIFDKTTSIGVDRFLAIPPFYLYQVPLTIGSDWNDIALGMFWSYTNSASGDANVSFNLTSTAKDKFAGAGNYTYIGLGLSAGDPNPQVPRFSGNLGFAGIAFDALGNLDTDAGSRDRNRLGLQSGTSVDEDMLYTSSVGTTVLTQSATYSNGYSLSLPFPNIQNPTDFAGYLGLRYTVIDKDLVSQKIRIEARALTTNENWNNNDVTNVSLTAVQSAVRDDKPINNYNDNFAILEWNTGNDPLALPDSLIFFNNWPDIRPRIHSWVIRKYS